MSESLLRWCIEELRSSFGLEACEEIVQYVLAIDSEEEMVEYVRDLLQGSDGEKRQFIEELVDRWRDSRRPGPEAAVTGALSPEVPDTTKDTQKKSKRKGRNKQETVTVNPVEPEPEPLRTPLDLREAQESRISSSGKKKNKFVNLYATEGQERLTVLLPGRHACDCLAQKHKLVSNCMACGRIVCEQEGSGPCLFCGSLVCTKEEMEVLQRDSNKSQKLRKKLMGENVERDYLPRQEALLKAGLEKAVQHKDKLLEFDKNSVCRTQVLDDEADYFATHSNQWLSPTERAALHRREEELHELRHTSRKERRITLDFAGRQVLEDGQNQKQYYSRLDETVQAISTGSLVQTNKREDSYLRELLNPNIMQAAPQWVDVNGEEGSRGLGKTLVEQQASERSRLRIQDRELQEMADGGWCLSMHQPWASLLIKGIKRVEGRSWYTSHRGRLWIAAAAKRPLAQEISDVEAVYRQVHKKGVPFPTEYPTGCLLGCVNVVDCLSQEQFKEQYPQISEESASPFVFVCSSPLELLVKFPMKGKHKIWKLDSKYHQAAKKGLKPSAEV
ncbi:activating signal cointegrator 1 isoform X2 [Denticeps clupeoides]|uniref:Activating signal cointegrator 1 n=1 Tax=Denticeps clupeoides TaxID=299321 RepID=A0AAY4CH87_9TELE|nr:activating signal cointegrator 1 isoform X2 [Denticeps clupeoides]